MTRGPDLTPLLPDDPTVRARARALGEELAPARRRRARTLGLALVAAMLLGGGVAAASGLLGAEDVAIDAGIGCYDRASLDADVAVIGPRRDPIAACARVWSDVAPPPPLVACTGEDEPVRVFPGTGPAVCASLGLEPLPEDYAGAAAASAKARRALRALKGIPVTTTPCPSPRRLAEAARAALADVAVAVRGTEPCASGFGVDRDHVTVDTVSREQAANDHAFERITRALRPTYGSTVPCRTPEAAIVRARRLLDAAGLADVRLEVEGEGPCVQSGHAIDAEERLLTFTMTTRAEAAANAARNDRR